MLQNYPHQFYPIPPPFDDAGYNLVDHIGRGHEKRVQRAMRRLQWTIGCQVMGDFEFELYGTAERTGEFGWIFLPLAFL